MRTSELYFEFFKDLERTYHLCEYAETTDEISNVLLGLMQTYELLHKKSERDEEFHSEPTGYKLKTETTYSDTIIGTREYEMYTDEGTFTLTKGPTDGCEGCAFFWQDPKVKEHQEYCHKQFQGGVTDCLSYEGGYGIWILKQEKSEEV